MAPPGDNIFIAIFYELIWQLLIVEIRSQSLFSFIFQFLAYKKLIYYKMVKLNSEKWKNYALALSNIDVIVWNFNHNRFLLTLLQFIKTWINFL